MPKPVEAWERSARRETFAALSSRFSVPSLGVISIWAAVEMPRKLVDEGTNLVSSEVGLRICRIEWTRAALSLIEVAVEMALEFQA